MLLPLAAVRWQLKKQWGAKLGPKVLALNTSVWKEPNSAPWCWRINFASAWGTPALGMRQNSAPWRWRMRLASAWTPPFQRRSVNRGAFYREPWWSDQRGQNIASYILLMISLALIFSLKGPEHRYFHSSGYRSRYQRCNHVDSTFPRRNFLGAFYQESQTLILSSPVPF